MGFVLLDNCLREAGAGGSNPLTPTNKSSTYVFRFGKKYVCGANLWDKFENVLQQPPILPAGFELTCRIRLLRIDVRSLSISHSRLRHYAMSLCTACVVIKGWNGLVRLFSNAY